MESGNITQQENDPNPWKEIIKNLDYLTQHLTNLDKTTICLIENQITSENESEIIKSEKTNITKNDCLWSIIRKKDYKSIKTCLLNILRNTGNGHCADKIEGIQTKIIQFKKSCNLTTKWWPEIKTLPLAFHKRELNNTLLIARLKEMLVRSKMEKMAVITQKVTVSGLGGVGKTTTAVWYAQEYQHEYDYILWMDCGEKALFKTFNSLARVLKLEDRQELQLKELASGCFQILKTWKCLFIFDNAESYTGNQGIKEVLPKLVPNFDILITSRNKEWGNATGDGEIPQFQMNVFDEQEGVEFVKENIQLLQFNELPLVRVLCDLLGNLPLALQIAVATLNKEKIRLQKYIDRIQNTPQILNATFDNYEKTINITLKISMDLIKDPQSGNGIIGEIAYRILTIFGYITPDYVPSEFFMSVEKNLNTHDIDAAINLLERYSLLSQQLKFEGEHLNPITSTTFNTEIISTSVHQNNVFEMFRRKNGNKCQHTFSIHRLLQQVIRLSTKESHEQILEKILVCEGFLDYKLIPFSFANEELQNKFPKIKTELIGKLKLIKLLRDRRFSEAVELSRIISNTLKDPLSMFNFAVCLKHNSEFKESEDGFKSVLTMLPITTSCSIGDGNFDIDDSWGENFTQWGTTNSAKVVTESVVLGQLFSIYLLINNTDNAINSFVYLKQIIVPILPLKDIIDFLDLIFINDVFLQLHEKEHYIILEVEQSNDKKLELYSWDIVEHTIFLFELQDLCLTNCKVTVRDECLIIAKNVTLCNVVVFKDREDEVRLTQTLISDLVDVSEIKSLNLENMTINSCTPIKTDQVTLKSVKVNDWSKAAWVINELFMYNMEFTHQTELSITKLEITHSSVDVNVLPKTIIKLKLNECFLINCCMSSFVESSAISLPLLLKFSLINVYIEGKHGEQCTPFDISHFISPTLNKLKVIDFGCNCSCLQISMNCLASIKSLELENCSLELSPNIRLVATKLKLNNVRIVNRVENEVRTNVNYFVDKSKLDPLNLLGVSVDFNAIFDIRESTLINSSIRKRDTRYGSIKTIRRNPRHTQKYIDKRPILKDPENVGNTSSMEIKKWKLLIFLKSISGSKTISGLRLTGNKNVAFATCQEINKIAGVLPGILTTVMPRYSAVVEEWQSFIDNTISDWNNHYLVHIRYILEHPLDDILKDGHETSWFDLIEEKGERNKFWKESLDTLAPFLLQLQSAGVVPILDLFQWINSNFFLWSGRSGLDGSLKLYQITKDYLKHHHGLTSLIWNWSLDLNGEITRLEDYWPGNNCVDVISVYLGTRTELRTTEYQKLLDVAGDKPIAMEGYYVPSTELLATATRWTWFTVYDDFLTDKYYNSEENTKRTFQSPSVINRGTNQFFYQAFSNFPILQSC